MFRKARSRKTLSILFTRALPDCRKSAWKRFARHSVKEIIIIGRNLCYFAARGRLPDGRAFLSRSSLVCKNRRQVNSAALLAPQVGLEPTTFRLTAERSAIELLRNIGFVVSS